MTTPFPRMLICLAFAALLSCLSACGGGDVEDDATAPDQANTPPACQQRPDTCR